MNKAKLSLLDALCGYPGRFSARTPDFSVFHRGATRSAMIHATVFDTPSLSQLVPRGRYGGTRRRAKGSHASDHSRQATFQVATLPAQLLDVVHEVLDDMVQVIRPQGGPRQVPQRRRQLSRLAAAETFVEALEQVAKLSADHSNCCGVDVDGGRPVADEVDEVFLEHPLQHILLVARVLLQQARYRGHLLWVARPQHLLQQPSDHAVVLEVSLW
mmetsp:Transcript_89939/g.253681  ORF Transcript_89939/g.253681 Transcript_89939/m.253681 type:complete len:215 (-) Transcript_89939:411-1055(-)